MKVFGWGRPRRTPEEWRALSKMLGAPVRIPPMEPQTHWAANEPPFTVELLLATTGPVIAELPNGTLGVPVVREGDPAAGRTTLMTSSS